MLPKINHAQQDAIHESDNCKVISHFPDLENFICLLSRVLQIWKYCLPNFLGHKLFSGKADGFIYMGTIFMSVGWAQSVRHRHTTHISFDAPIMDFSIAAILVAMRYVFSISCNWNFHQNCNKWVLVFSKPIASIGRSFHPIKFSTWKWSKFGNFYNSIILVPHNKESFFRYLHDILLTKSNNGLIGNYPLGCQSKKSFPILI